MFPRIWTRFSNSKVHILYTAAEFSLRKSVSINSHTGIKERKIKKKQDSVVEHRLRQTSLNRCLDQLLYFLSKPWGKKHVHRCFKSPPASALDHTGVAILLP